MKEFNPLVSIVIPVYNGANYVAEAIESALNQTYKNIEIIVVNDGSTDNTEKIVKSYGDKVRYFYKENGGTSSALNLGVKNMKGDYFSWLSHDDMYYPNKIEKQIEELKRLDDKNTMIYSNSEYIDKNGKGLFRTEFEYREKPNLLNFPIFAVMFGMISGCSLLISKSIFVDNNFFDETLRYTQDYDLWYRLKNYNIKFITDVLVKTRIHESQDYQKINQRQNDEIKSLWTKMLENITEKELNIIGLSKYGLYECLYRYFFGQQKNNKNHSGIISYIKEYLELHKEYSDISKIKVSIVVPFYNRINYLLETIDSVKKQTHKNWELILINDGSTENIYKVKELCDDKIKLYDNSYGKGVSSARNLGMDIADGDYLAFLDSDDLWLEDKIEKHLKNIILVGADFSYTNYTRFFENGNNEDILLDKYIYYINKCYSISPSTVIISKNIYQNKYYRFRDTISIAEDICFFLKVSQDYILFILDESLTLFRSLKSSAYKSKEKVLTAFLNIYSYLYYEENYNRNSNFYHNLLNNIYKYLKNNLIKFNYSFSLFGIYMDHKYLVITIFGIKITFKIKNV